MGFNAKLGDTGIFWKTRPYLQFNNQSMFQYGKYLPPRATVLLDKDEDGFDYEDIKAMQVIPP